MGFGLMQRFGIIVFFSFRCPSASHTTLFSLSLGEIFSSVCSASYGDSQAEQASGRGRTRRRWPSYTSTAAEVAVELATVVCSSKASEQRMRPVCNSLGYHGYQTLFFVE